MKTNKEYNAKYYQKHKKEIVGAQKKWLLTKEGKTWHQAYYKEWYKNHRVTILKTLEAYRKSRAIEQFRENLLNITKTVGRACRTASQRKGNLTHADVSAIFLKDQLLLIDTKSVLTPEYIERLMMMYRGTL